MVRPALTKTTSQGKSKMVPVLHALHTERSWIGLLKKKHAFKLQAQSQEAKSGLFSGCLNTS
jgi:hypothetical protein